MATTTIVRGRVVMEEGETVSRPGWGRYVARGPAAWWAPNLLALGDEKRVVSSRQELELLQNGLGGVRERSDS